jgi:hypothetical protein
MAEYVKRIDMIKRYSISIADGGSVVLDSIEIVLRTSDEPVCCLDGLCEIVTVWLPDEL